MFKIEKVDSEDIFRNLESDWDSLLKASDSNTVFLTWAWLFNWWKVYRQGKELFILLAKDEHKILGIAPLFLKKSKIFGITSFVQLCFLGSEDVGSDYLDIITEKGNEIRVIEAFLNYFESDFKKWNLLKLTDFSKNSKVLQVLYRRGPKEKYHLIISKKSICPYISLTTKWEDYLESLSRSMQYNLRRKKKRLGNDFNAKFKIVSDQKQLGYGMDDFIQLNRERAKFKGIRGAFLSEKFVEFHKNILPTFFDRDMLRIFFILADCKPISGLYVFKYNQKYLYYQSALDMKWNKASPGLVLFGYCIENAIKEGMKEFDFLRGREKYKFQWTKEYRENFKVFIFNHSFLSHFTFLTKKLILTFNGIIKGILVNNHSIVLNN